jgi:uncharacterized protein
MSAKVAIIGTGISGMACAHVLRHVYDITLFEKNNYVGGHTNTVVVNEQGREIPVDTGFMVFNPVNYPNLTKLFDELKVPVKKTEMSFSVQHIPASLEYSGSGLNGLFAQRKNIFNLRHMAMLFQIDRFNKMCVPDMRQENFRSLTVAEYVQKRGFGEDMLYKYLLPMTAALWSTPTGITMDFPIRLLVNFFSNHGFLGLNTQHQWYTIDGGSREYRRRLTAPFTHRIRQSEGIVRVRRSEGKSMVTTTSGVSEEFDKVIFACHADQALEILSNPYPEEVMLLSQVKYQKNIATLHSDSSVMPKNRNVWSSWNYRIDRVGSELKPSCIYNMNKLQQVSDRENYFVSINDPGTVREEKIHRVIEYEHPIFTLNAMHAQPKLSGLNKNGPLYFCGSYFRYGFHEDAFTSAIDLCRQLLGKSHVLVQKYQATLYPEFNVEEPA